jgi:hypothetical protein
MGAEFMLLEVLTSSQGDASTGTVTTVIVDAFNLPIDYKAYCIVLTGTGEQTYSPEAVLVH